MCVFVCVYVCESKVRVCVRVYELEGGGGGGGVLQ